MQGLFKDVLQEALEAELDSMLGYGKHEVNEKTNSRNGEFEPQIVPKHQRTINGIEDKVLSLYSKGMTTRDISGQIKELYEVDIR